MLGTSIQIDNFYRLPSVHANTYTAALRTSNRGQRGHRGREVVGQDETGSAHSDEIPNPHGLMP